MKQLLRSSTTFLGAIIAGLIVVTLLTIGIVVTRTHATQTDHKGSLITIYDRGVSKVIATNDATIGDALHDAGYTLAKQDVVEPAASQKIVAPEYHVNIYRARPVIVVDGAIREKVMTAYQTPDQIAQSVGITLYPEDVATIAQSDDIIADGASLEMDITRATPFNFDLYGTTTVARTQAKTVGDMLKEKGITLGPKDQVSPAATTPLTANMNVQVWRNGVQTITVQQAIPFDTQKIDDANENVGYVQVQTPGQNGTENVTYQVDIEGGQEVSRTQIAVLVTQPAVQQVEVVGIKLATIAGYSDQQNSIMDQAGIAVSDRGYVAYIIDHENALWCPTRWQGQNVCPASYDPLYSPGAAVGYGVCQATPGDKMASAGADWETNPVTQLIWCSSYATSRYGSWAAAAAHWQVYHSW